ncbi:Coatomer beta subunit [Parasponia andersonii]|uniref:Coatomer beta subunit n=1 Tax=Parasponia andersonii TaxID=3476 RepID=A0A2P5B104_PARAD|nr:Coatomer beta subunit [Parasponia andersonii]
MEDHHGSTSTSTSTAIPSLHLATSFGDEALSSQTLARIRALILNPSTPDSTLSSIFQTLTRSLELTRNSVVLHHTLKLLSDLSSHRAQFSRLVFDSVRANSLLSSALSTRLAAQALDVVVSIAERDPASVPAVDDLGDGFFASLCFGPSLSVRLWLLRNAERFRLRSYLSITLFLGFTKDPYPCVRKAALDGLVRLSGSNAIEDEDMIRGCYYRAVELLRDMEDTVRSAAVRAVCAWGLVLVATNPETRIQFSDEVFVKLCSMARDMSVEVRVEAFSALRKIEVVSEDILLQTLSKRVLGIVKEKKSLGQCCGEQFEILASSVAGALLHGLEDEFFEVRKTACHSLSTLIVLSTDFALEALNLLMDILNDDTVIVRLQALETVHCMATCDCLKLQEKHMHLFLGPLVDKDFSIRCATRKILKLVKLSGFKLFNLTVDALLDNVARYPEDEFDSFSALFHFGRNHGKFVVCIVEDISQQIEPTHEGKLDFDNVRVAALLVLAISAPLSGENASKIPPTIFSYAVTLLGRISNALTDVMSQSDLLDYLSQCSRSTGLPVVEVKEGEQRFPLGKGNIQDTSNDDIIDFAAAPLQQKIDGTSETQFPDMDEPRKLETSLLDHKLEAQDEVIKTMNAIIARVKDLWPLVQSGDVHEVLRMLRSCREELATFDLNSIAPAGVLAFTLQYLQTIKLLSKVWSHFLASKFLAYRMGTLDLLFGKLDKRLRELRVTFIGLSKEAELHVLELVLVTYILRLLKVETCCKHATLRKLSGTISRMESLLKRGVQPSNFVIEVVKFSAEIQTSASEDSCDPYLFKRLLAMFCLKEFLVCGRLKYVKAELDVPNNESENPIHFVSGLPVGITCQITLCNILVETRLWLKMTMDDGSTQFLFLDLSLSKDCNGYRRFSFVAPFYRTPKAVCFTIRLCIGMECPFEDAHSVKHCGGPKHELAYLCKEREVFLSMICKG